MRASGASLLLLAALTFAGPARAQDQAPAPATQEDGAKPAPAPETEADPGATRRAPAEPEPLSGADAESDAAAKVKADVAAAQEQGKRDADRLSETRGHQNVLSINTVVLGRGQIAVEYERAVHPRLSLFVSPQPVVLFTGTEVEWGFLGELGARVFLVGEAPSGLFLAPELLLAVSRQAASGVVTSEFKVGYGAMLGLTVIFFERLVLSGGLGLRWLELENAPGRPLKALPRVSVGFAF